MVYRAHWEGGGVETRIVGNSGGWAIGGNHTCQVVLMKNGE